MFVDPALPSAAAQPKPAENGEIPRPRPTSSRRDSRTSRRRPGQGLMPPLPVLPPSLCTARSLSPPPEAPAASHASPSCRFPSAATPDPFSDPRTPASGLPPPPSPHHAPPQPSSLRRESPVITPRPSGAPPAPVAQARCMMTRSPLPSRRRQPHPHPASDVRPPPPPAATPTTSSAPSPRRPAPGPPRGLRRRRRDGLVCVSLASLAGGPRRLPLPAEARGTR
ncbi:uncharacterized protein A4U43_C08F7930 [Asparagus officinalis]|nr:uncharacterized protein A4U43_C08F7930 [Asparagus officinalis]